MSVCDHTEPCAYCKTKPKWIYRVGEQCICGACCAAMLAEQRQENARLRAELATACQSAWWLWQQVDDWCGHVHHNPQQRHGMTEPCPVVAKLFTEYPWLKDMKPYRVENQQPADVTQDEWRSV